MAEVKIPDMSLTGIGNVLGGLGVAMIVDMKLMDGVVTSHIPGPINLIAGLMIFGAVWLYVYKQLKKLN